MTRDKDRKRCVRVEMAKTGSTYARALAELRRKRLAQIPPKLQRLIGRLDAIRRATIERHPPRIDRGGVEQALAAHFDAAGMSPLPIRWQGSAEEGIVAAWRADHEVLSPMFSVADLVSLTADAAWRSPDVQDAWERGWRLEPTSLGSKARDAWSQATSSALGAAWLEAESVALMLPRARLQSPGWALWTAGPSEYRWPAHWPWNIGSLAGHQSQMTARAASDHASRPSPLSRAWIDAVAPLVCAARFEPCSVAVKRWIDVSLPFLDAAEAGLWLFWVLERAVIAVPRPELRVVGSRLHSNDGPAVSWPGTLDYRLGRSLGMEDFLPYASPLHPEAPDLSSMEVERHASAAVDEAVGRSRPLNECHGGRRIVQTSDTAVQAR